jgi:hypothetical protein
MYESQTIGLEETGQMQAELLFYASFVSYATFQAGSPQPQHHGTMRE